MELPAKVNYAVRAAVELAKCYPQQRPVPLYEICQQQHIPDKFLIQILLRMKNAGLVHTMRGSNGGYALTRSPAQISLADIFRAVDERFIHPVSEIPRPYTEAQWVLATIWKQVSEEMCIRLENISLEDMLFRIDTKQVTYSI